MPVWPRVSPRLRVKALRDAHRRIKELEDELALVKAASETYDAQAVVDPKGDRPSRSN